MKITILLFAIVLLFVSTSEGRRCMFRCNRMEKPVCGSDGKTYHNGCMLRFEACKSGSNVYKKSEGHCS
ncbi:unnamed protein product [Clavelina lepadiformis]|uniref:Kazal-like domain-containing protein n=1 Tax=Clavelina lepadiformis TaxID=159417 RepID=A0ABP0FTG7_CLALP